MYITEMRIDSNKGVKLEDFLNDIWKLFDILDNIKEDPKIEGRRLVKIDFNNVPLEFTRFDKIENILREFKENFYKYNKPNDIAQ